MISYKNPSVRTYKTADELRTLKRWFYHFDETQDLRFRAVQRTSALLTRGKVPHGLEATLLLTLAVLNDKPTTEPHVIQMTYASALVRFVNGLLDPMQLGQGVIPNSVLAQSIRLPFLFVEFRNTATHDSLPSVDMCRITANKALAWLLHRYWLQIDAEEIYYKPYQTSSTVDTTMQDNIDAVRERVDAVSALVKTYKKQRKLDPQASVTKQITAIRKFVESREKWHLRGEAATPADILAITLIHRDFLIYNHKKLQKAGGVTFNPLWFKLYQPLIEGLGMAFEVQLLLRMLEQIGGGSGFFREAGFVLEDERETSQLLEWVWMTMVRLLKVDLKVNGDSKTMEGSTSTETVKSSTQQKSSDSPSDSPSDTPSEVPSDISGTDRLNNALSKGFIFAAKSVRRICVTGSQVSEKVDKTGVVIESREQLFDFVWGRFKEAYSRSMKNVDGFSKVCEKVAGVVKGGFLESCERAVGNLHKKIELVRSVSYTAPSLDDILGTKRQRTGYLCEEVRGWVPKPMGVDKE